MTNKECIAADDCAFKADADLGFLPVSPDDVASRARRCGATLPDVFDRDGWTKLVADFAGVDPGHLIDRLVEFRASGASATRAPAAGADGWRGPVVAKMLDHVRGSIDHFLTYATANEGQADVARKIAVDAITHPASPYYDRLRSAFHETLSEVAEDAKRIERLTRALRCNGRVVPLDSVPEPNVESHEERVDRRLDIEKAIAAEAHPGRKAALEMTYEGMSKSEIADRLGVSPESVRLWLRDLRHSRFFAPYAEDFVDWRLI